MVIFPLAPDQTIAQMWSNGARGGFWRRWPGTSVHRCHVILNSWNMVSISGQYQQAYWRKICHEVSDRSAT